MSKTIVGHLSGCGRGYALASIVEAQSEGGILVITTDSLMASRIEAELSFFLRTNSDNPCPILSFPDWETLPYDGFSPHQDIISERLSTLYQVQHLKKWVLLVPMQTLMHYLCPKDYLAQNSFVLSTGDSLDLNTIRLQLENNGYINASQVMNHGEFSIRGSILDLFPMGSHTPYRIDLLDNEVDTIRTFDAETQRSIEKVKHIRLLPAKEFPLTPEVISSFRTRWREQFEGDPQQCSIYLNVTTGCAFPGLEYYLPLFFDRMATLFDYIPSNSVVVTVENCEMAGDQFIEQVKARYEQYRHDRLKPILDPKSLFLQTHEVFAALKNFPRYELTQQPALTRSNAINQGIQALPDLTIQRIEGGVEALEEFLNHFQGKILYTAESIGRLAVYKELLSKLGIHPKEYSNWLEFTEDQNLIGIVVAPLEEGMILDALPPDKLLEKAYFHGSIAIIPESVVLGRRVLQSRRRTKQRTVDTDLELRSLAELTLGDAIVHIDYGIGRYLGLVRLQLSDQEGEFIAIEYAGGDKLYVSVFSVHLLSRYSGIDVEHAPLHRLGTTDWEKIKRKVLEETRDVAAELLEIYAKREIRQGFKVNPPDAQYAFFCSEFPFEETIDQQKAIEQVIADLTIDKAMDRVVCGDVGFGKTEVALRAAFLVVHSGKQVAVLVPTTLLAEQHHQTFLDRFARFPIRIEVLSRFKTKKEQEAIIHALKDGKVDILIGTHKILQKEIQFKSLGLLIIDEEHRFGVRQKEAFKAFRSEVDILTLTATPIPRTLNMAMSGMRDLSIIATPPAKRLSVKTFVREKNKLIVEEAILREIQRGGQVYYLYNFVETIDRCAEELQELVPSARISVAHGQMRERELEQVMLDFYHHRYNVLVCTTIIETGIDIPTANTIIIDRADKFGLAQLHQLRGRVGRSHHQAYAFCLTTPHAKISVDAKKRLDAIESLDELGAGFNLATHDLEIRGAGELLGEEQSGNIQSIGFPLYMELLDKAVKTLRSNRTLTVETLRKSIEIDLQLPALIPEHYLPDVHARLILYKRISNVKNKAALEDIKVEMIDRFGPFPEQVQYLFSMTELRLVAEPLGIIKIDANTQGARLEFDATPNIDPAKIIALVQKKPEEYQLEGSQKLRLRRPLLERELRIAAVKDWITSLAS